MKNQPVVIATVGTLVGFILGFFTSQILVSDAPDGEATTPTTEASQMPAEHPPPEVLDKLQQLRDWATANSEDSESRIALGNTYYDLGRFDAAITWYENALLLVPENVDLRTDLGTAYLYTGNPIKAVEHYRRSLELDPVHSQTLLNLGVAYLSTGNMAEALRSFENLLEQHPEYPRRKEIEEQIQLIQSHLQGDAS